MSTNQDAFDGYSRYYRGPRTEQDHQRWLDARVRRLKRRCLWAVIIGAVTPVIFILIMINMTKG